jgi:hypothetical protein
VITLARREEYVYVCMHVHTYKCPCMYVRVRRHRRKHIAFAGLIASLYVFGSRVEVLTYPIYECRASVFSLRVRSVGV